MNRDSLIRRNGCPTVKQAGRLLVLSSGNIALAPTRGDWGPLIRRGWVEPISEDDKDKRFLPPVRITPDGLRAVAAAMERYPADLRPEIKPNTYAQVNESPMVTRLKGLLKDARQERDDWERRATHARSVLAQCRQSIGRVLDA